ncbi:hypothetical protein GCM10008959_32900 [Deinococcus seoulensis]|uniref:Uncharacterized protein n=1 Tax=Deinococcus seoulensis TaxID=1837379 RepID=A0ABQ2RYW7_9DEIO|nr:hypothetical protein [Deinococcus seoulensis]GGR68231.1 hypothetical protein GCM10008959_32900 [Deinococcus seoulensis]
MFPVRQTVTLTGGSVTLHAWGADVADAHLFDLLTFTSTFALIREHWEDIARQDVQPEMWAAFWRLTRASLRGQELPQPLTWADRLALLTAMWDLNDPPELEGKLDALSRRAGSRLAQLTRGHPTPPSTST